MGKSFLKKASIALLLAALLLAGVLYYIRPKTINSPEEIISQYFKAEIIRKADPLNKTVEQLVFPKIKITLLTKDIFEKEAQLIYRVERPDLSAEVQGLLQMFFSGKKQEEVEVKVREILAEGKYKTKRQIYVFRFSKEEEGSWKLIDVQSVKE